MDQLRTQTDYEFGGFRLDTVLQVLIAPSGEPIALPARAYDALRYLVERAGELVDKASLMRAVWPHTVVEDNNLNQCILTLRRALGEAAGDRRFILTVPGRGFKFVAPVRPVPAVRESRPESPAAMPVPPDAVPRDAMPDAVMPEPTDAPATATTPAPLSAPSPRGLRNHRWYAPLLGGSALLAVAIVATVAFIDLSGPVTVATDYVALTDLSESATAPAISADGRMLAFIKGPRQFLGAGQIYVKLLPDGEPTALTPVLENIYGPAFSPDGSRITFTWLAKRQGRFSWDTWTVPPTGGQPALFLANAAGLSWIAPHELLYSEISAGIHMGVVTSTDDRSGHRDIYLPAHERGMAHYSYLSPDRSSVLVVEMNRSGDFQQCRVLPFDGRSAGQPVGPAGSCISAAWSPDGRWMYFSAQVAGHNHLWRQRFPRGQPQQITFGPTEEIGVAVAPDGRSLVTSLGLVQQSIWLHDTSGERRITTEKVASQPWLSPDARRLYFLSAQAEGAARDLWRVDIPQGQREPVLQGLGVVDYDVAPDERLVVFSTNRGEMQVWQAPPDHHAPPRLLARGADQPAFDRSGHIFYRVLGDKVNYLYRMQADGSGQRRVLDRPIIEIHGVSPTGRWATLGMVMDGRVTTAVVDLTTGAYLWTREGYWPSRWAPDGSGLYLEAGPQQTLAVPLTGTAPPHVPEPSPADAALLPHPAEGFAPGPDPGTYAFIHQEQLLNIYRIPLRR